MHESKGCGKNYDSHNDTSWGQQGRLPKLVQIQPGRAGREKGRAGLLMVVWRWGFGEGSSVHGLNFLLVPKEEHLGFFYQPA